jgi:uncharacterized membrane protein YqiK
MQHVELMKKIHILRSETEAELEAERTIREATGEHDKNPT